MLQRCVTRWVRRKHGQKAWSPLSHSAGAAPANGVSAQEMLHILYRPLPPQNTVEYEEDFGSNMIIHREFVSDRARDRASFEMTALAYSDVELRRGREQLATTMNRERRDAEVGQVSKGANHVPLDVDLDPDTRELRSARYLFNEQRMQYCERFQNFFRDHHTGVEDAEAGSALFSLMEACAIVHGCDTAAARETYYAKFLSLDLDSLERDEAALRDRVADVAALQTPPPTQPGDNNAVQRLIDAVPPLLDPATSSDASTPPAVPSTVQLAEELEEFAPLYKAYLAHARGEAAVGSYDVATMGATASLLERRRWRALMERLVREDYHALSHAELADAVVLNGQLHTVKFLDLKVGDTVVEIMQLLQRETGDGSSVHRVEPMASSATHPERR